MRGPWRAALALALHIGFFIAPIALVLGLLAIALVTFRYDQASGLKAAIAAVAKAYRVYFKKVPLDEGGYTMDHTAIVYLMDKAGRFVSPFNLKRTTDAAAADLRRYL